MFEKATRQKFRFHTAKGNCSVEDLWDLPLEALDSLYRELNGELREQQEESLLNEKQDASETLQTKIDIVKCIVNTRLEERRQKEAEVERKRKKQKIMEIIEQKQEGALWEKSVDELRNELDNL